MDLDGVRGFVPSSQLDSSNSGFQGVGKKFTAKMIEFDRKANSLILSQRSMTQESNRKKFEAAGGKSKSGEKLRGKN